MPLSIPDVREEGMFVRSVACDLPCDWRAARRVALPRRVSSSHSRSPARTQPAPVLFTVFTYSGGSLQFARVRRADVVKCGVEWSAVDTSRFGLPPTRLASTRVPRTALESSAGLGGGGRAARSSGCSSGVECAPFGGQHNTTRRTCRPQWTHWTVMSVQPEATCASSSSNRMSAPQWRVQRTTLLPQLFTCACERAIDRSLDSWIVHYKFTPLHIIT